MGTSSIDMKLAILALALVAAANAIGLNPDNFDEVTSGKSVFIKFLAPWGGHCKSMKPAWDKLMEDFKDSKTALVADVDCTVHQDLCGKHGVQGYPTIKYGDPNNLEDYQGGRSYDDLSTFAKAGLSPSCRPLPGARFGSRVETSATLRVTHVWPSGEPGPNLRPG